MSEPTTELEFACTLIRNLQKEVEGLEARIADLEKVQEKNERTIKNMSLAVALSQEWIAEKDAKIAALGKTLAAVPLYHSDEYSDYVCTYCLLDDGHKDDCVAPKEQDGEH